MYLGENSPRLLTKLPVIISKEIDPNKLDLKDYYPDLELVYVNNIGLTNQISNRED